MSDGGDDDYLTYDAIEYQWIEAEAWQMGLYGPGGHYLPHYDAFDTLVLFLNDCIPIPTYTTFSLLSPKASNKSSRP